MTIHNDSVNEPRRTGRIIRWVGGGVVAAAVSAAGFQINFGMIGAEEPAKPLGPAPSRVPNPIVAPNPVPLPGKPLPLAGQPIPMPPVAADAPLKLNPVRPLPAPVVEPAPAPADADEGDPFKEMIDILKQLGGNEQIIKQLQDALKANPGVKVVPLLPGANPPFPPAGLGGAGGVDQRMKELQMEMMRRQQEMMKMMMEQGILRQAAPFEQGRVGGGMGFGQGRLGIRVEVPNEALTAQLELPAGQGLVCADVPAESAAGKAGIKPFDILLEVDGKAVPNDVGTFIRNLKAVKPNVEVNAVVLRKGRKETIKGLKLPEIKAADPLLRQPGVLIGPNVELQFAFPDAVPFQHLNPEQELKVEQVDDSFSLLYNKNGVKMTITGSKVDGVAKADSIQVESEGKTISAESIDKLPKEFRTLAEKVLKNVK